MADLASLASSAGIGLISTISGQSGKTKVQFIQNSSATIITFDASIKETHSRKSPATEFPVENGDVVSDHILVRPFKLELTGIITDTPITGTGALLTSAVGAIGSALLPPVGIAALGVGASLLSSILGSTRPSVAAYEQLLSLQQNATPFDVLTSLKRYPSMWITDLSAPRDNETGDSLMFTVELSQLILVSPLSVNVQIFANPGLSAGQADLGQNGLNLSAQYQAGFSSATNAVHSIAGGPIAGGAQ